MSYGKIKEEELKNKIGQDYFGEFDSTKIVGNIDFCVTLPLLNKKQGQIFEIESLLWAEAKRGKEDIYESFVQLILTIGKARTFDNNLPPAYLGAFDAERIAFIPYNDIHDIFYTNDFNWNVTSSNHKTKEFKLVLEKVKQIIENKSLLFLFDQDEKEIKTFIKNNFIEGKSSTSKIKIDKNNFVSIYNKWLSIVKPTISFNWKIAKENRIIDGDFYLADLLSSENVSLKDSLYVVLKTTRYELNRHKDEYGAFTSSTVEFTDKQKAHTQFWNKYDRPPKEEYWDYIAERRDLLVPQDVRERKGSFFTPQIWVELSQKYLTDVLGENWQDEYYIWDCAAGTGNLLTGLTNKYNIWASTIDTQDVEVMKDRIDTMNEKSVSGNGANLLKDHIFQFDFLNDDFSKLPKGLKDIINNAEKRKKLVLYINPPYAEASNRDTVLGKGENKSNVATKSKVYKDFSKDVGTATRELFVQFFLRIYKEIPDATLASFSTLKFVSAQNFLKFRHYFKAEYKKGFICKANTFDNVNGNFPIGFLIWNLESKQNLNKIKCDIFEDEDKITGSKKFYAHKKNVFIINWLRKFYDKKSERIAYLRMQGTDMQNNKGVYFTNQPSVNDIRMKLTTNITKNNIVEMSIYLTMRHFTEATWLNDRDQFLHPNKGWFNDTEFQNNCLTFALFQSQNKISSKGGINYWIPFSEQEVNSREKFDSNFMANFIKGNLEKEENTELFINEKTRTTALVFSAEATNVFDAGRALWKYYHSQPDCNVNASLYDIREHFQGRNASGKMNNKSEDETYMNLITDLRDKLKVLAKKIEPKVYEYEFLKH